MCNACMSRKCPGVTEQFFLSTTPFTLQTNRKSILALFSGVIDTLVFFDCKRRCFCDINGYKQPSMYQ